MTLVQKLCRNNRRSQLQFNEEQQEMFFRLEVDFWAASDQTESLEEFMSFPTIKALTNRIGKLAVASLYLCIIKDYGMEEVEKEMKFPSRSYRAIMAVLADAVVDHYKEPLDAIQ